MNPLPKWCDIKGYGSWCYNYCIPEESDFIEGFKYEVITFTIYRNYNKPQEIREVFWKEYTVGEPIDKFISRIFKNLKAYLEAGYIRSKYNMKEKILKELQNFINKPFYYSELCDIVNKHTDVLLNPSVQNKIGGWKSDEYCALFDTIWELNRFFLFGKDTNYVITSDNISVYKIFNHYIEKYSKSKIKNMTVKSKYKLNPSLVKPNLNFMSNLYEEIGNKVKKEYEWFLSRFSQERRDKNTGEIIKIERKKPKYIHKIIVKTKGKSLKTLKKIIPKYFSIVDTISKYPSRFLGIYQGYKPLHTLDEIKNNLYNHQPEKSPNRLVYIATKDRKDFMRLPWKDADEKIKNRSGDEPEWEYISKQEGKKFLRPNPGPSLTPPLGSDKWYKRDKIQPYSSTKHKDKRIQIIKENSKKEHNKRITLHNDKKSYYKLKKKTVEWKVIMTKHQAESIGEEREKIAIVKASNEAKAKAKGYKLLPKIERPYYKAVVERFIKSDINGQLKKDRSNMSFLEAKKRVLITTLKDGNKKVDEITTYIRKYPKKLSTKKVKNWKHPIKNKRINNN